MNAFASRMAARKGTALGAAVLSLTVGCAFPQRRRLPEIRGQLLDAGAPVTQAKIGSCWDWSPEACDESLRAVALSIDGKFVLSPRSEWGIGVLLPIPDYGRPGWQLCFESPDGRRRSFRTWWNAGEVANLTCDIGRAAGADVCTWRPGD